MMRPHFCAFIPGTAARIAWKGAVRLMAMIASHFSGGKSSIGRDMLDAGVVDEDVDRSHLVSGVGDHRLDLGPFAMSAPW